MAMNAGCPLGPEGPGTTEGRGAELVVMLGKTPFGNAGPTDAGFALLVPTIGNVPLGNDGPKIAGPNSRVGGEVAGVPLGKLAPTCTGGFCAVETDGKAAASAPIKYQIMVMRLSTMPLCNL